MQSTTQELYIESTTELIQVVTFHLGVEEFAIDILMVQEIIRIPEITLLPNAQDFVEGVINLRGRVLPVIDLGKKIGLPVKERSESSRIIVVEIHQNVLGCIVDKVNNVLRINPAIIDSRPSIAGSPEENYISGIAKMPEHLLIVLDMNTVVSRESLAELST